MQFVDLVARKKGWQTDQLEQYVLSAGFETRRVLGRLGFENADEKAIVAGFERHLDKLEFEREMNKPENVALKEKRDRQEAEERKATASMLITSGFNFEGYRIVKYSGYISGDDVVQVDRGLDFLISRGTDTGSALSDALVKIRRNALRELKKAAYDLGCNAVIGVDFDYITLDPQTANIMGGTTYMPYVFCVTANGNAVVIEKIED